MLVKIDLIKNFRFVLLVILVLISIYLIITVSISTKGGLVVSSVKEDSKCKDLRSGDSITQVSGYQITTIEDFEKTTSNVKSGEYVPMVINGGPGGCIAVRDGYLGIVLENAKKGGLEFSIDLQGGYITQFKPVEKVDSKILERIVNIFRNRIKTLGITDTKAELSNDKINITSKESGEFLYLTKICKFTGIIDRKINIKNETANLNLGNKTYSIEVLDDNSVKIGDKSYSFNQSISLDDIDFILKNISSNSIELSGIILTTKDASKYQSVSGINFDPNSNVYYVGIPLLISSNASEKFIKLTDKMDTIFSGGQVVLISQFKFFIDNDLITQLNIPRNVAGKELQSLSLLISGVNKNEVLDKKTVVDLCLDSGQLPITVEKFNISKLEPSSTNQANILIFSSLIITTIIIAVSLHHKTSIKLIWIGIFLSIIEITIIFGLISASQQFLRYMWLIDIPTLFGVIVVFVATLIKMFFLKSEGFITETNLSKINLLLRKFVGKLDLILVIVGFVIFFTVWKGFGLSIVSGIILWLLIIKPLYNSLFRQS